MRATVVTEQNFVQTNSFELWSLLLQLQMSHKLSKFMHFESTITLKKSSDNSLYQKLQVSE